jgi:hypothetical protein
MPGSALLTALRSTDMHGLSGHLVFDSVTQDRRQPIEITNLRPHAGTLRSARVGGGDAHDVSSRLHPADVHWMGPNATVAPGDGSQADPSVSELLRIDDADCDDAGRWCIVRCVLHNSFRRRPLGVDVQSDVMVLVGGVVAQHASSGIVDEHAPTLTLLNVSNATADAHALTIVARVERPVAAPSNNARPSQTMDDDTSVDVRLRTRYAPFHGERLAGSPQELPHSWKSAYAHDAAAPDWVVPLAVSCGAAAVCFACAALAFVWSHLSRHADDERASGDDVKQMLALFANPRLPHQLEKGLKPLAFGQDLKHVLSPSPER